METTPLLIEIVIIGFQILIWISLIVMSVWGVGWVNLSTLKDWAPEIALGLIAVSYTFGIILDSLTASFFAPWSYHVQRVAENYARMEEERYKVKSRDIGPQDKWMYILATNSDVSEHLEKLLNQGRLLRSTSVNLILISVTALIFILRQVGFSLVLVIFLLIFSILLIILAILTWSWTQTTYYYQLNLAYIMLKALEKNGPKSGK